jgi:hypothetical protein
LEKERRKEIDNAVRGIKESKDEIKKLMNKQQFSN